MDIHICVNCYFDSSVNPPRTRCRVNPKVVYCSGECRGTCSDYSYIVQLSLF